jgi:hypothetical protein
VSSPIAERGFCGRCGSVLTFQFNQARESIDLAIGAFDEPDSLPPVDHVYRDTRVSWMDAGAGLPERAPYRPPGS